MLLFCFLSFAAFGVVLVLVGANQHALAEAMDLSLAQSGLLSSALALGIGVGVVSAGPLFDRYSRRPLYVGFLGAAAIALGTANAEMEFSRWTLQLFFVGVGIGGYDTLINATIAQRYGVHSTRPMTLAHAGASVGAMLGPLAIGWITLRWHWVDSFRLAGAAHAALAIAATCVRFPAPEVRVTPSTNESTTPSLPLLPLLPLAVLAFAYVGIEASLTVFAIPYSAALGLDPERGRFAISTLWLGLFAGRIGILALPGVLGSRTLMFAGAFGSAAIGGSIALGAHLIELWFFAIGLALGCVYPLVIAITGQRFPKAQGTAAGLVAGAGALGGFALPWITGMLGDASGALFGIASLAAWCLAISVAARVRS